MTLEALDAQISAAGGARAVVTRAKRRPRDPDLPLVRKLDFVLADQLDDGDEAFDDELIDGCKPVRQSVNLGRRPPPCRRRARQSGISCAATHCPSTSNSCGLNPAL